MPRPHLTAFFHLLDALETPADAEFLYDERTPLGALRRRNLQRYLALMAERGPRILLVGEAPGYRGATVTGIPFMSVRELEARPGLLTRKADGDGFEVPDGPTATWEASSAVVSKVLRSWRGTQPMSWPISPNHPFELGAPLTNRTPRPAEVRAGLPIALELIHAFDITTVLAVGRTSERCLAKAGIEATALRHPAQGGARIFAGQLAAFDV